MDDLIWELLLPFIFVLSHCGHIHMICSEQWTGLDLTMEKRSARDQHEHESANQLKLFCHEVLGAWLGADFIGTRHRHFIWASSAGYRWKWSNPSERKRCRYAYCVSLSNKLDQKTSCSFGTAGELVWMNSITLVVFGGELMSTLPCRVSYWSSDLDDVQ